MTDKAYQIHETLKSNTKYYWQVEAKDTQTGKTTLSQEWTFKTAAIAPPNQKGAKANTEDPQIELTYDKPMKDPTGKHSQFIVKKAGETPATILKTVKIESKPGTTTVYILTLEEKTNFEDTLTIDYTIGNIQSQDGGYMEPFRDYPVKNQPPVEKPVIKHAQTVLKENNPTKSNMIALYFDQAMMPPQADTINQFTVNLNEHAITIKSLSPHPTDSTCYLIKLREIQPILYETPINLTYIKGTIQAQNGKHLESFTHYPVENTVNPLPPQVQRVETNESGDHIILTFDKAMQEPVNERENFVLTLTDSQGNPTDNIAIQAISLSESNSQQMILTLASPIPVNQNSLLSYTPGNIQSQQGAL